MMISIIIIKKKNIFLYIYNCYILLLYTVVYIFITVDINGMHFFFDISLKNQNQHSMFNRKKHKTHI